MSVESAEVKAETTDRLIPDVEISCGSERSRRAPGMYGGLARCSWSESDFNAGNTPAPWPAPCSS
jgi:hypothetical protein